MRTITLALATVAALLCTQTGCGAALSNLLPKVVAAATDVGFLLDEVESFADLFFAARPDPVRKGEVDRAISRVRSAADNAVRVANDGTKTAQDADAALSDLRKAWAELMALTEPLGVRRAVPGVPERLGASPDGRALVIPEPLALSLRAQ